MNLDNYMKIILSGIKTWVQSTFAKKSDIKELYYSETKITTIVDNLTSEDYNNGNKPACNFIAGASYDVIWNDTLYEGLVCFRDGSYNVIGTPEQGYPFYIDDDGGNGLYISSDEPFTTVSIIEKVETVHQIDNKYIPLATSSKPGAVHPHISTEPGGDVWMDPNTGRLYSADSYTLPVATYTTLGGVKPATKTSAMTQLVGVDGLGRLYTTPSSQNDYTTEEKNKLANISVQSIIIREW